MTLTDVLTELRTVLLEIAPSFIYLEQGNIKTAHFTVYPVSTTANYSVSCVGSIGETELVQVDAWAKTLTEALRLEGEAIAAHLLNVRRNLLGY